MPRHRRGSQGNAWRQMHSDYIKAQRALARDQARMVSDQGAAVAVGGGLLCSECGTQQDGPGRLDGSGRCAQCAP